MARVYRDVDLFMAPSRWIRAYYAANGFDARRIVHCGYGLDTAPYERLSRKDSPAFRIGYFGGPHPAKGLAVLLAAAEGLPSSVEVHVYGGATVADAPTRGAKCLSHGVVTGREKEAALAGLDAVVVPSLFPDNAPLTIHEARAAALPVVGSRIGGIPELVDEGETGFLFAAGDADGLRQRLQWFVDHPVERARMRAAIRPVKTIAANALEIEEHYQSSRNGVPA
jgi:glycosyltransferase involved in cell wall biosynthesis